MDSNSDTSIKQCFRSDQNTLGSLNIASNACNSMTVMWNRHQIFVYEELSFENAKIIEPEFQIHNLLLYNNHIACLDCSRNVHIISLKFKNRNQKRFKSNFYPRKQNVLAFTQSNADMVLTVQYSADIFYLSFHQINKEFQIEKESQLLFDNTQSASINQKDCILQFHPVSDNNLKSIKQLFNVKEYAQTNDLILFTFDKMAVYACLTSTKVVEDDVKMVKLYSCLSEICNIQIVDGEDLKILIGLKIGTIIEIAIKDKKSSIIHLNTAIHKFNLSQNSLIHTDGCTMWKTENIFSKDMISNSFFVKQVKDFVLMHDKIFCTTYSKLIYIFGNDESSYAKSQNVEEYAPADKLLNNNDCINKIMEEIKTNNELVQKLSKEENYITALSLSNRQDVMNTIISMKIVSFQNYEDAVREYIPVKLTEDIHEYFKPERTLFLINVCVNTSHSVFNTILSNLFTDLKIHVSFSTENKLLKTTSIKFGEQLKNINYLIPLKNVSTRIHASIVLVTNIPGTYDEKQSAWTVLYRKHFVLNSENFIITNNIADKLHLNETETCEDLILKTAQNVHGNLFKFTDISQSSLKKDKLSFYVRLPENYPEVFKNSDYCDRYLNFKSSEYLKREYTSMEFLKAKNYFVIMIDNNKVKLEVVNDGFSNPVLKVTSEDLKIALDIRNFFASLVYNEFHKTPEFINHTFYTTVENVQIAVKNFITECLDPEEFTSLAERFERNVIGALPI